jgi:hypothetical protein
VSGPARLPPQLQLLLPLLLSDSSATPNQQQQSQQQQQQQQQQGAAAPAAAPATAAAAAAADFGRRPALPLVLQCVRLSEMRAGSESVTRGLAMTLFSKV